MDIRDLIIRDNPELKTFTQSDQYKLSRTMMKIRYKLSFSSQDLADLLDISLYDYVNLESGDMSTTVIEYNEIVDEMINLLIDYQAKKITKYINDNTNLPKNKNTNSNYISSNYSSTMTLETNIVEDNKSTDLNNLWEAA